MENKNALVPQILAVAVIAFIVMIVIVLALPSIQKSLEESRKVSKAKGQVKMWANTLAKQTTSSGTYDRYTSEDLPETDPWDNSLKVTYSNGLVMEELVVRSAGKDKSFNTPDDITATRKKASLKGAGNAIKDNIEETAENGAKGASRGAVKGFIEGIKEGLKGKDKDKDKEGDEKNEDKK